MLTTNVELSSNLLLASLTADHREALAVNLKWVDLDFKEVLCKPGDRNCPAYFPVQGICSIISVTSDSVEIETGLIGREGFIGTWMILYADRCPYEVVVQGKGRALRISRAKLLEIFEAVPQVRMALLRFVHTFNIQTAHTALANGYCTIEERLARWILMSQDRLVSIDMPITHDFLSKMLAVRRSGVTDALHILEGKNAIRSTRGNVHITDRSALKVIAKGAYGYPEAEYERLIGPLSRVCAEPSEA
jgi:CRP-like cAMP-binding protein